MTQTRGIRILQYLDNWLLRAPCQETCRQLTQTLLALCRDLGSKLEEIRVNTSAGFQFLRLPVRPVDRSALTHSREMVGPTGKVTVCQEQGQLHCQTIHVPDRFTYSHRETGLVRSPSYETHTMASEAALGCPGDSGKDYPDTQVSPPTSRLVIGRTLGSTIAPTKSRVASVYRCLK